MQAGFDLDFEWGNNGRQTNWGSAATQRQRASPKGEAGCLAVSVPWTEVEAARLRFHARWSCMGISNERPG